jgi:hypothetical protein
VLEAEPGLVMPLAIREVLEVEPSEQAGPQVAGAEQEPQTKAMREVKDLRAVLNVAVAAAVLGR